MQLKLKMLSLRKIVPQIRSKDWFVTIDLKDAYFHISILPCHRRFLRFAFGGKAYQNRVLPFRLALSPCTFTKCVDAALVPFQLQGIRIMNYIDDWLILAHSYQLAVRHRDVVLAHMKELGLWLNAKKSVLSPLQRTTADACAPARIFSQRGNPFRMIKVTRRCFRALVIWKKPWFLSQGPVLGASCRRRMLMTDTLSHGLGSDPRGTLESRSVEGPASLMAHQPS